jgi:hypothetical protein
MLTKPKRLRNAIEALVQHFRELHGSQKQLLFREKSGQQLTPTRFGSRRETPSGVMRPERPESEKSRPKALVVIGFLIAEHVRGSISLGRHMRALSAQREKMNPQDFKPPPPTGENGAPEVLAAAKDLKAGLSSAQALSALVPKFLPSVPWIT